MLKFIAVIFLLIVFGIASGSERSSRENKYVKMEVAVAKDTVRAGEAGSMLITLTPIEGIHINVDPAVEVMLEKDEFATLGGDPEMSSDKETGFLAASTPIEQGFIVSSGAAAGEHVLKGTIVYYFCSDAQGWCTKFSQPFSLKVNVLK